MHGLISGTPTKAGRATVMVSATDDVGSSGTAAFLWTIVGRPRVSASSLRMMGNSSARVSLSLAAGAGAAGIKRLVVSVPHGIQLSSRPRDWARGVSVTSALGAHVSYTSRLLHGALVITLTRAARQATVRFSRPELSLSKRLITSIRARHARTVKLQLTATDAGAIRTQLFTAAPVITNIA